MKIGIIGAGMVGGALTKAFTKRGHKVVVSSTDPASEKMKALIADAGSGARAGVAQDAVDHGEVIVLATPWGAAEEILTSLQGLNGKIILDAANPIKADFSGLENDGNESGGEAVQRWAKGAYVVKALNQIGFALMDDPQVASGKPVMFIAGDDEKAKKKVAGLVDSLGFQVDDAGPLSMSRYLEALAWIWINRAMIQGKGPNFALVLSKAQPVS